MNSNFIIGADSLFSIEKWVHPEKLLRTCILLAAYRNGKGTQEMLSQIHYLARKYECDIRLMNTPDLEVSSSDIRKKNQRRTSNQRICTRGS